MRAKDDYIQYAKITTILMLPTQGKGQAYFYLFNSIFREQLRRYSSFFRVQYNRQQRNIFQQQIRRGINKKNDQIINNNKVFQARMFYHFNFQTQANLQDIQYSESHDNKSINLPTTSHNSPGSIKSDSIDLELDNSYDNSFEQGTQATHANTIWDASIDFLKNSLYTQVDEQGFNSSIFHSRYCPTDSTKTLDEAIKENTLLRSREKSKFIQALQSQTDICGLLVELMLIFNGPLFNEILYVVQNIWERKYQNYREKKNSSGKLFPQFSCFFGFEGGEQNMNSVSMFEEADISEIKRAAMEGIEELGHELFYSKKLKYLNLQAILHSKVEKQVIRGHFIELMKVISKSVFLSGEGIYEDEVQVPIFSEQDQEDCEPFELEANRFVRTFSQIQQEDEFDSNSSNPNKRRKLL